MKPKVWLLALLYLPTAAGATALQAVALDAAPQIDGRIGAEEWAGASWTTTFNQIEPEAGAAPGEATRLAIAHDQHYLYLAIDMDQRSPLIARQWQRNSELEGDDHVSLLLDPFGSETTGYRFQVNANGAMADALIEDVDDYDEDWEDRWFAASGRSENGWQVEMAIPLQTLGLPGDGRDWRINVGRFIASNNELVALAGRQQRFDLGSALALSGIRGTPEGHGITVQSTASLRWRREPTSGRERFRFEPSLDVFHKLSPSLTLAGTLNTDFSAAEVDQRELNLSRFDLFFPERRDFFLRDANVFRFGGIEENALPFFSRRIGLGEEGDPLDLHAGVRLSGRIDELSMGLLAVRQDVEQRRDPTTLAVARLRQEFADHHALGAIATYGDPLSGSHDRLYGIDYRYSNDELLDDNELELFAWWQKVDLAGGGGDDQAFGLQVEWPNDRVEAVLAISDIGADFAPPLGFVNRNGIRDYNGEFRYRWRPDLAWLRTIDSGIDLSLVEDSAGRIESRFQEVSLLDLGTEQGDHIEWVINRQFERLNEPFELTDEIEIDPGHYHFNRYGVGLETAPQRVLAGAIEWQRGRFFDGRLESLEAQLRWYPWSRLQLGVDHEWNRLQFSEQRQTLRLARLLVRYAWSATLNLHSLMQYDNESHSLGWHARLRWTPRPGQEHFLVLNLGRERDPLTRRFRTQEVDLGLRLGFSFQF